MSDKQHDFLRLLGRPPARLNAEQTAWALNCQPHDVPALVAAKLLRPLGHPSKNSVKFFATDDVLKLASDREKMSRLTAIIQSYWTKKNVARSEASLEGRVAA